MPRYTTVLLLMNKLLLQESLSLPLMVGLCLGLGLGLGLYELGIVWHF